MSKFEETSSELIEDISPLQVSREEFLAICVKNKISKQYDKYNKLFDYFLNNLEKEIIYSNDLSKSVESLLVFSKITTKMYDRLINEVVKYQENLNKRFQ